VSKYNRYNKSKIKNILLENKMLDILAGRTTIAGISSSFPDKSVIVH
jgi:hypothetical protein